MTALSDALIYSSPLLGEMDFLGDCTDWCTLKMASEASWSLVRVHTWLLHFDLFIYLSQYVCKSSCIVGFLLCKPRLLEHHVYYFLSLEKKHKTGKKERKKTLRVLNYYLNSDYYYPLPAVKVSSDTLFMTWNLYRHQTSLPMCWEWTEYSSRDHSDEHRGTSFHVKI